MKISIGIMAFSLLGMLSCRDIVMRSRAGEYSRGTYNMLLAMYKDENIDKIKKGVDISSLEQDFIEKLKTYEALGSLAYDLGIETQEYYAQYLALHKKFRYSKAAFAWWREKLGLDFSFSDVFNYYQVKVNADRAVEAIEGYRNGKTTEDSTVVGHWLGGTITLANLRQAVTSVEYKTFLQLEGRALREALPEKIREYLALVAHNEMRRTYRAYESELQRWDHCQVADKFVRVKYGIAGKGIYPDEPLAVPITMEEIYDAYHLNLNRYARLEAVTVTEYFVPEESAARELARQLTMGKNTAKPGKSRLVKAYNNPDDFREKEQRSEADNAILTAAYSNTRVSEPYRRGNTWAVAYIHEFRRAEEPKIEKYNEKIEQDIRLNLLRRQYDIDLSDKKEALHFKFRLSGA